MKSTRLSNLLFLSGLAAIAPAGCDSDDGDSDSAATATDGPSMTSTGGEDGTMGGSTSPDGTGGTTETPDTTTGDPTAPPTTTSGDAGVCPGFATKSVECNPDYDYDTELGECMEVFASLEMYYAADCIAAYEEVLACASTLDCEAFNAEENTGCQAEEATFEEVCGIPTGGSSSGGGSSGG